jgi:hypothetical protein
VLQFLVALILLGLLFGRGHAQPTNWQSHQLGSTRYYQGTDQNGGQWNGSSYRLGGTTYFDAEGPNGQAQHCSSYRLGFTTHTECWCGRAETGHDACLCRDPGCGVVICSPALSLDAAMCMTDR